MLSAEPRFHEFLWRGVAERGVLALSVVERFDVIEQISLRLVLRTIAGAMHTFILQTVEEVCLSEIATQGVDEKLCMSMPSDSSIAGVPASLSR